MSKLPTAHARPGQAGESGHDRFIPQAAPSGLWGLEAPAGLRSGEGFPCLNPASACLADCLLLTGLTASQLPSLCLFSAHPFSLVALDIRLRDHLAFFSNIL